MDDKWICVADKPDHRGSIVVHWRRSWTGNERIALRVSRKSDGAEIVEITWERDTGVNQVSETAAKGLATQLCQNLLGCEWVIGTKTSPNPLNVILSNSRSFHARHSRPISNSTTLEGLLSTKSIREADLHKYIESTRIIVHPIAYKIAKDFLAYKKIYGSKTEHLVYGKQIKWSLSQFLVRLVKQRPLAFYGQNDITLLRNHKMLGPASSLWDLVGSDHESKDITMHDYLTYEEMMISSLIGVSGYTPFLNDGNRFNRGIKGKPGSFQLEGVEVGLVGARFERKGKMDSVYVDSKNVDGFAFNTYFKGKSFEERYKTRISITIETLLREAEDRGGNAHQKTYLHVVGLGLGAWMIDKEQSRWYIEGFTHALWNLKLQCIAVLEFAYIDVDAITRANVEKAAQKIGAQCVFNRRAPSTKLKDPSLLLVVSYAWDANAYPGNEYYNGLLDATGDPAAACSSAISETQNPEINTNMLKSIVVLN